jgi:hypothetical protein
MSLPKDRILIVILVYFEKISTKSISNRELKHDRIIIYLCPNFRLVFLRTEDLASSRTAAQLQSYHSGLTLYTPPGLIPCIADRRAI